MIWMTGCSYLILEIPELEYKWSIEFKTSIPNGVPSDYLDPWVEIKQLHEVSSLSNDASNSHERIEYPTGEVSPVAEVSIQTQQEVRTPETSVSEWLLEPHSVAPAISTNRGLRPSPSIFFPLLWNVFSRKRSEDALFNVETKREVFRIFAGLKIINHDKGEGERFEEFRQAWLGNRLDWYHAELQQSPHYRDAMEKVKSGDTNVKTSVQIAQINMARALGQLAYDENKIIVVGDSAITQGQLTDALFTT